MGDAERPPRRIRVVVADDHPLMVHAVEARLEVSPNVEIVGTATNTDDAIALCQRESADVAIFDLAMTGGGAIEALSRLRETSCGTKVLVLSSFDDPTVIHRAVAAGAAGYLHKGSPLTDLVLQVEAVADGELVLDTTASSALAAAVRAEQTRPRLSEREREVLSLIAQGSTNAAIADALHVSASTAKTYLERIFDKLDVRDRAAAVARAKDLRLI